MMNKEGFLWLQEMLRGVQHDRMSCSVYGFSDTSGSTTYFDSNDTMGQLKAIILLLPWEPY